MSKSFSNPTFYNSGKPAFGNTYESGNSSNYLRDKKAKLLYNNNYRNHKVGGSLGTQDNYLLFDRAKLIKNLENCDNIAGFNTSNLVSGLYTTENLGPSSTDIQNNVITGGVNVITKVGFSDLSCNVFSATSIDLSANVPFYYKYKIDPCGLLFGNSPCGYNNYENFRVINKPYLNTAASLNGCSPINPANNPANKNKNKKTGPIYTSVYTATGDPIVTNINGYTVLMFTGSGTIQFQGSQTNVGYIVVGGGGAGGGGSDGGGWGGGGGGGAISYNSKVILTLLANQTYKVTIGSGGSGVYDGNGKNGSPSSIIGTSVNIVSSGGGGGVGGSAKFGVNDPSIGGAAGTGAGIGGNFTYDGPLSNALTDVNYTSAGYPKQSASAQIGLNPSYSVNYKLTHGGDGTNINIPSIKMSKIFSSGGGAGWNNLPGQAGTINGGGISLWGGGTTYASNYAKIGANGNSGGLTNYGCGGGGSGGGVYTDPQVGPYLGGDGSPGVVIIWFFSQ